MSMATQNTNRLINEKSPYLLQHAHNPVDWYPWGKEACLYSISAEKNTKRRVAFFSNIWERRCLLMAEKKLIIGANEMTEVIYIGSNLNAKGGRKKKKKRYLGDKRSDFTYDELGRQVHEKQIVVGKYHVKNYKQRNKRRSNIIKELISNNFQPGKCMMITLTCPLC